MLSYSDWENNIFGNSVSGFSVGKDEGTWVGRRLCGEVVAFDKCLVNKSSSRAATVDKSSDG